jgi:DNA helicase II / ATP-dependent DNA helicase PcrA
MSSTVTIDSNTAIDEIDRHIRVTAGPGAGKTFWLAHHIRHVCGYSTKVSGASRVACISHTNTACEELKRNLQSTVSMVDVSTIHSFLYRCVVKPYLHLVLDDLGEPIVNYKRVHGHDNHRVLQPKLRSWIETIGASKLHWQTRAMSEVKRALNNLAWHYDRDASRWQILCRKGLYTNLAKELLTDSNLRKYKQEYWKSGLIDHDDVLHFAHLILAQHRSIRDCLSARFPYMFVDEFQDTNSVQADVVRWLANSGTTVGVVGDIAQAIYGFVGAEPVHFRDFSLPNQLDLQIKNNRRSTNGIIKLLNHIRTDLQQEGARHAPGDNVRVVVGTPMDVVQYAQRIDPKGSRLILTRTNEQLAAVRSKEPTAPDPWGEMWDADPERALLLEGIFRGLVLTKGGMIGMGIREVLRGIRIRDGALTKPFKPELDLDENGRRALAVILMEAAVVDEKTLTTKSLLAFYKELAGSLKRFAKDLSLVSIVPGKRFGKLASSLDCGTLTHSVNLGQETSETRTIHQAKGAEADNVIVCLHGADEQKRLDHILKPTPLLDDPESRVTYVGLSRARDRLFIGVSGLSEEQADALIRLSIEVIRITPTSQAVN